MTSRRILEAELIRGVVEMGLELWQEPEPLLHRAEGLAETVISLLSQSGYRVGEVEEESADVPRKRLELAYPDRPFEFYVLLGCNPPGLIEVGYLG